MQKAREHPTLGAECIEALLRPDGEGERAQMMTKAGARLVADALLDLRRIAGGGT